MGDYENLSRRDRLISLVYREQSRGTLVVSALCLPSSLQTIGIVQTSSLSSNHLPLPVLLDSFPQLVR
jgi:hypothetical protein